MRLLIDDSAAFNQAAGIGRYARNVLPPALGELAGMPGLELTVFWAPERRGDAPFARATLESLPTSIPKTVRRSPISRLRLDQLWHRAGMSAGAKAIAGSADLVYCPDFLAPPLARTPTIVTVHDLAFLVCPERAPRGLVAFLRAAVVRQVRSADAVAVVSETSRRDVVERLGIAPDRAWIVPNGVDERFYCAQPPGAGVRTRLGLPERYLLMVGTLEPRKNHEGAFAAMRAMNGRLDMPLLVAGKDGWEFEPIRRVAADLVATGRVRFLDFVPDADLPSLYAGAAALVYPSWYEGFGLPVLEALAAGIPVATSDAPALREVGGDLVEVASPADPEALAGAIDRALASDQNSGAARAARRARARQFGWPAAGSALARLLRAYSG
jgi:glycosyltransferase involved in cell wall biosynthesis